MHNMGSFRQTIPWIWPWYRHLPWSSWNFEQDRSFVRTLFKNIYNIVSLLFFLETRSHNLTQCEDFTFFLFFWISYAWFKTRSKRWACGVLARSGILQNSKCISDETTCCVPKNDFCKKPGANYKYLYFKFGRVPSKSA